MDYSSSLTDKEWEIIEPLLPKKKRTRASDMEQARNLKWGFISVEKWL